VILEKTKVTEGILCMAVHLGETFGEN